jgi:DNA polymerase III epsilon subunit-like protein
MASSMEHWNGNQMCVIDCETTGLDPNWNEMWQLCVMPLDSNLNQREDVPPFFIEMKPEHPERAIFDNATMRKNRKKMQLACTRGLDPLKAIDLFREWTDKLDLPFTRTGLRKKIKPLGQNYAFDRGFLMKWLGIADYDELFDYHYDDTMNTANYLNNVAAMKAERVPFTRVGLSSLARAFNIEFDHHDALQDCLATAKVYKAMLQRGLLA